MRLIPGPADVLRLADRGYAALDTAISLVPRLVAVLDQVEVLIARVSDVVGAIERTEARARLVVERTDGVVDSAQALTDRATPLLDRFEPVLDKLEPISARIVDTTSPDEVEAVVELINLLPDLVGKIDADILPILDTLATVAPDLRDLLDVSKELNEIIGGVPGLGRIKRRIDREQDEHDGREYRADEQPASSPDRKG